VSYADSLMIGEAIKDNSPVKMMRPGALNMYPAIDTGERLL
jgi:hypothetical protein